MSNEVALKVDFYEELNQVVERYLKGDNATAIARHTGMKRVDVLNYIDEWRSIAQNDENVKARAREALTAMTLHYDLLISEFWKIHEGSQDEKNKLTALKHIADVEKVRQDTLQKVGMYDDAVLGDDIAQAEEQILAIKNLLLKIVKEYPTTKADILAGLSKIFGEGVGVDADIVVEPEDDKP